MGIKFHCPNGHKLNVKSFLAGKKGVCPKCGTRMRIPTVSEPGLDSELEEPDRVPSVAGLAKSGNGSAAGAALALPGVAQQPASSRTAVAPAAAAPRPAPVGPADAAASPAVESTTDPIAEAPAAIWYVRPPTGGQYGPAKGEIMRKWVSEGRVSSDSLVWREGWADWRSAGQLFPDLQAVGGPKAALGPAIATIGRSTTTAARY